MNRAKIPAYKSLFRRNLVLPFCTLVLGASATGCSEKTNPSSAEPSATQDAKVALKEAEQKDANAAVPSEPARNAAPEPPQVVATIDGGNEDTACGACREAKCKSYEGVDLVSGCFKHLDIANGAPKGDLHFNQECADIVRCARDSKCAYGEKGPAGCYCGSATVDQCAQKGPAPDASCLKEWQAGSRSKVNTDVQLRFTDLTFPAGWAYALLDHCDRELCASECVSAPKKKTRAGTR